MLVDDTVAQGPEHKMVQVVRAECAQELREVRMKFEERACACPRATWRSVPQRRRAETRAEIAARRLNRMEREQYDADDAEHEANPLRISRRP